MKFEDYCRNLLRCLSLLFLLPFSYSSASSADIAELFDSWCRHHAKSYSDHERLHRLRVFQDNYHFIVRHNAAGNSSYSLALNAFSDLTPHEFRSSYLGLSGISDLGRRPVGEGQGGYSGMGEVPPSVDWRKEGAVTGVKDQGSCGACWSFSATGAIEGINKIVTGSLVSLSEQELVDCDKSFNAGCGGGLMDYAYGFVINNGGIDTEEDYPYGAREKTCNKDKLNRHVVTIDGYVDVPPRNEKLLLQAVASQPVSVGISGGERAFQLYSEGIFTGPCSTSLDHAVLIVGYGSKDGVDYWIVKNSWGRGWGMNGYVYMRRNSGDSEGLCGINTLASYPSKTKPNPPPPPPPGPTKCDLLNYCPQGQTCCCASRFIGICLSWKCCDFESAVCCKDHTHCCPHDYPVCDTKKQQCLKHRNATEQEVLSSRRAFLAKPSSWLSLVEAWVF
ncbi:hypothetical protein SAY87_022252 [Trapa incisa]|uniref:Uncharacterized protein n=1 Tax=Trapa incisa TaxID=236973 RepID=A0AAN7PTB5_9MYRT|nr:hypothetical protein SAY87_022252 [Trapa incisa]